MKVFVMLLTVCVLLAGPVHVVAAQQPVGKPVAAAASPKPKHHKHHVRHARHHMRVNPAAKVMQ